MHGCVVSNDKVSARQEMGRDGFWRIGIHVEVVKCRQGKQFQKPSSQSQEE